VTWTKVTGATYQVRWATSTSKLGSAHAYAATNVNRGTSPR